MSRVSVSRAALALLLALTCLLPLSARAEAADGVAVTCRVSKFDVDENYSFSPTDSVPQSMASDDIMGRLTLVGSVRQKGYRDSWPIYEVGSGNIGLRYSFDEAALSRDAGGWNIINDDGRDVDGVRLNSKLGRGALIVQASLDAKKWVTEYTLTDLLKDEAALAEPFYSTSDIQLQNGCYFRVLMACRQRKTVGRSQFLFFQEHNEYEERKLVEIYSFYAISSEISGKTASAADRPRREFGRKVKVKTDSGYTNPLKITADDSHYGWELGSFVVNGYTRETGSRDTPVFLKTLGDKVTLWFHLNEDIDRLNGNDKLSIARDRKGSDVGLEIRNTDFGRGALFIRFTDYEGVVHEPVMYLNYLEANTRTGADTRVQLFEEGDYEVVLDYKIVKDNVGPLDEYGDYRIAFSFSIRNGNCMVFPLDSVTGNELTNGAVTPNGFKLDMAKSRYLTIDVKRSMPVMQPDGTLMEDVRFNRPAADGDVYNEEGIYTFTVRNAYTKESTVKTIYVGTDRYVNALSRSGFTIAELNSALGQGATVAEDGEIIGLSAGASTTSISEPDAEAEPDEKKGGAGAIIIPIAIVIAAAGIAACFFLKKHKGKDGGL